MRASTGTRNLFTEKPAKQNHLPLTRWPWLVQAAATIDRRQKSARAWTKSRMSLDALRCLAHSPHLQLDSREYLRGPAGSRCLPCVCRAVVAFSLACCWASRLHRSSCLRELGRSLRTSRYLILHAFVQENSHVQEAARLWIMHFSRLT